MSREAPGRPARRSNAADSPVWPRTASTAAQARDLVVQSRIRAVILVEGWSDQAALETLAQRQGQDLEAGSAAVLPIAGILNLRTFLEALGPHGLGIQVAGIYDMAEEPYVVRSLERAGLGTPLTRTDTEALGFFACQADLEDELIRALGGAAVETLLDTQGELALFRAFQNQPFQRGRDHLAQLRRFMGTRAGRKIRYGSLLVGALTRAQVPRPLNRVLQFVERAGMTAECGQPPGPPERGR